MEKIVEKVKKYKMVEDGCDTKITYKSKDGRVFDHKEDAINCDKMIDFESYFKEKYGYGTIWLDKLYHTVILENDGHLNFSNRKIRDDLRRDLKKFFYTNIDIDRLNKGLNFIDIDDSGDYIYSHINTLKGLKKEFNDEIKQNTEYLEKLEKFI